MLDAVERLDIDNPDSAKFDEVPREIGGRSHKSRIRDLPDDDDIIADEAVSAADQLESCLRLADAALTHDQHALAVDIDKNAVDGNARREFNAQPADDLRHKTARRALRDERRHSVFSGNIEHLLGRLRQRRENDAWDSAGNEPLIHPVALELRHLHDICIFDVSDDLNALLDEMFVIPCQLESRPVDIRSRQLNLCHINVRCQVLELQRLCQFRQTNDSLHMSVPSF